MKRNYFVLIAFIAMLLPKLGQAQCGIPGFDQIKIHLTTDTYPQETSWRLFDNTGALLLSSVSGMAVSTFYEDSVCVPVGTCVKFEIQDSYGDGICCAYGNGSYEILVNGAVAIGGGSFGHIETQYVNCPPGTTCGDPFVATTDSVFAAYGASTWYEFTPDSTGMYNISTCFPDNTCNTRLWVYDHCSGLIWDSLYYGTTYFNEDACGIQAYLPAGFQAGLTYYIRVGGDPSCSNDTIFWEITYGGPVVGCTDSTACNFNPLAIIDNNTCIYPGDPNCNHGPDLVVDENILRTSLYTGTINGNDVCLIGEGCIAGYGQRDIINFSTRIRNDGDQDYFIGPPQTGNSQFVFDNCHGHWHYAGYAKYELYDSLQNELGVGFKNGFCVLDLMCFTGTAKYGCNNMGITAGCADEYSSGLACQWVDITDVPDGKYTLVVKVNWDHSPDKLGHVETNFANNTAYVCFNLSRASGTAVTTVYTTNCTPIIDCAGDTFGLAKKDCLGDCNGTRLSGDLDVDADRDSSDLVTYLSDIINAAAVAPCNDLNGDGLLTITDAAKLNGCVRDSAGTHVHPGSTNVSHTHCDFPSNLININHHLSLGISAVNTTDKYVDIAVANADARMLAVDFKMSGVVIDSITNLISGFAPTVVANPSSGRIAALAIDEVSLVKQTALIPCFRVYYSSLLSNTICVDQIYSSVNSDYEEMVNTIVNGCVTVTGVGHVYSNTMLHVVPNPSKDVFNVRSDVLNGQEAEVTIYSALGKIVFKSTEMISSGKDISIDFSDKAEGMYLLEVKTKEVTATTRLVKIK